MYSEEIWILKSDLIAGGHAFIELLNSDSAFQIRKLRIAGSMGGLIKMHIFRSKNSMPNREDGRPNACNRLNACNRQTPGPVY